jgi:hypothetical protein
MTELRMVTPAGEQLDETRAVLVHALQELGHEVDPMASTADLARQLAAPALTATALKPTGQTVFRTPGHRWAACLCPTGNLQGEMVALTVAAEDQHPLDFGPTAVLDPARVHDLVATLSGWCAAHEAALHCDHPDPALDEAQVDRCLCGALVDSEGRVYRLVIEP